VLGALVFVAVTGMNGSRTLAMALGFAAAFAVRGCAIRFGWSLPVYRERAGRTEAELEASGRSDRER
jgi:uncharacterized membrane protein YeiH